LQFGSRLLRHLGQCVRVGRVGHFSCVSPCSLPGRNWQGCARWPTSGPPKAGRRRDSGGRKLAEHAYWCIRQLGVTSCHARAIQEPSIWRMYHLLSSAVSNNLRPQYHEAEYWMFVWMSGGCLACPACRPQHQEAEYWIFPSCSRHTPPGPGLVMRCVAPPTVIVTPVFTSFFATTRGMRGFSSTSTAISSPQPA
jgi:hypothetical protein